MAEIKVDADKFIVSLDKYDETVKKNIKSSLKSCAYAVERDAKKATPVDTGRLRGSITSDVSNIDEYECEVGTNVEYASYVEYGTYKMAARPFLRPAYNTNIKKLTENLKKDLGGK